VKESLSKKTLEELPDILSELESVFYIQVKEVQTNKRISEIKKLGDDLKHYGLSRDFEALIQYGEQLSNTARKFDLKQIDTLLSLFPELIQQTKRIQNSL